MSVEPMLSGRRRARLRTSPRSFALATLPALLIALLAPAAAHAISNPSLVYVNQASGKCLDLPRASQRSGTHLQLYRCHGGPAQTFREPHDTGGGLPFTAGIQNIGGMCLDAAGAGTKPGTAVIAYNCHWRDNQQWTHDNETELFRGVGSKLCIRALGKADGAAIVLAVCDATDPQQRWKSRLALSADTVAPTRPGVPRLVEVRCDRARVTWAPSRDENTRKPKYQVLRDGQVPETDSSGEQEQEAWVALTPSTRHRLTVTASDYAGNTSAPGPELTLTTPACPSDSAAPTAPTGLKATPFDRTGVFLDWTAAKDNRGVVGYDILRDGKVIYRLVKTLEAPDPRFSDYTTELGRTYVYSVIARDLAGNASPPSATVTVTLPGDA